MGATTPDWCAYSAVEQTKDTAAVRSILPLAPHIHPASRMNSEMRADSFYAMLPDDDDGVLFMLYKVKTGHDTAVTMYKSHEQETEHSKNV